MRVLLVGVSCVGKTTIGTILARRLGCAFFDLDAEIERHFGTSIERLQARFLTDYSYRKECSVVLKRIAMNNPNCVIALAPSGLRDAYLRVIRKVPCVTVAIGDKPEHILERIRFYDIDSKPIEKHLTERRSGSTCERSRRTSRSSRSRTSGRISKPISLALTRRPAQS